MFTKGTTAALDPHLGVDATGLAAERRGWVPEQRVDPVGGCGADHALLLVLEQRGGGQRGLLLGLGRSHHHRVLHHAT